MVYHLIFGSTNAVVKDALRSNGLLKSADNFSNMIS